MNRCLLLTVSLLWGSVLHGEDCCPAPPQPALLLSAATPTGSSTAVITARFSDLEVDEVQVSCMQCRFVKISESSQHLHPLLVSPSAL